MDILDLKIETLEENIETPVLEEPIDNETPSDNLIIEETIPEKENLIPKKAFPEDANSSALDDFLLNLYASVEVELSPLATTSYVLTEEGWTPSDIGTWNPVTRIATLIKEVNQSIEIQTDCVLLTGIGCNDSMYTIDGSINKIDAAIIINGRDNITISNIKVINCPSGIRVYNSDNILIKENIFSNIASMGVFFNVVRSSTISTNEFIDSSTGIYLNADSSNIIIEKNLITNSSSAIYLNANINLSKITNNTIIKTNGSPNFYGISAYNQCNFNSIENNKILVQNSNVSSDSISIFAIYITSCSFLTLSNNKILIERNKFNDISKNLNINIWGIRFASSVNGNITCNYNDISLIHNNFSCKDYSFSSNIYLIYLIPSDTGLYTCNYNKLSYKNNTMISTSTTKVNLQFSLYGIYVGSWAGGTFINNNIVNFSKNSISSSNATNYCNLYGVYLSSLNSGTQIDKNSMTLFENIIPDFSYYAAFYFGSSNRGNVISNNIGVFSANSTDHIYGIFFSENNSGNKIQGNIFTNNQGTAIQFVSSNYSNLIEGNELCKNTVTGIYFSSSNIGNIIQNNCINSNLQNGVYFNDNNDGNNIIKNEINSNGQNGVYFHTNNDRNRIYQNSISHNHLNGILFDSNNNENRIQYNEICYNGATNINIPATNFNNIIKNNCIDKA